MNRIKQIRKIKGINVTTLAEKLQMSQSNLTKIENGKIELKPIIAQKIADILGVGIAALYDNEMPLSDENTTSYPVINPEIWKLPPYSSAILSKNILQLQNQIVQFYILEDDSMSPLIPKSAIALINTAINKILHNGIYLLEYKNQMMLRRLQKIEDNTYICLTENKSYAPQELSQDDIFIKGECIGSIISQIYN